MIRQDDTEFRIVSKAFDSWNVQFRIDVTELLDQQGLLRHLRKIKQQLARMYSLPELCMLFDGIVRKTRTAESVDVVVRIKKVLFEKGNPIVRFKEGIGGDGTHYANMTALLDIFYMDMFEKPTSLDRVKQALKDTPLAPDLLDIGIIERKVQEVLDQQMPIKGIPVAKGVFPDVGTDALVDYYFQAMAEPGNTDEYFSSRRVSRGDLLCRKVPATIGKNPGRNVNGDILPPRGGQDIEIRSGAGAELSLDATEVVADTDGVVVVGRVMKRVNMIDAVKEIPESITVKVNSVLRVEGNRVFDLSSSQTVEVVGDLLMGSKILTDCEVYVTGDVEEGTLIQAADDIIIEGQVRGATLHSDTNVITGKDVVDSDVSAKDQIIIKGSVRSSELRGDSVSADSVTGSRIVSRKSVTIERIDADENNILSTICVGMFDFFRERIRANDIFLEKARENLTRIEMLLGSDIMQQLTTNNVQTMMMRFLSKHRMGQDASSRKQVEVYRKLIESVPPTRTLVAQKERENMDLLKRIAEKEKENAGMIVIREKMAAKAVFSVDGVEAEVGALNSPATVKANSDGNLVIDRSRGNPSTDDPGTNGGRQ